MNKKIASAFNKNTKHQQYVDRAELLRVTQDDVEDVPETASAWCLGEKMNGWNKKSHGGG